MIDDQFRLFVRENISLLDELSRMYAQYRIDICDAFWEQLVGSLNRDIPNGYSFFNNGKRFEQGYINERSCGWEKVIFYDPENVGAARKLSVGFGNRPSLTAEHVMHGGWPIHNPWMGINVWLGGGQDRKESLRSIQSQA